MSSELTNAEKIRKLPWSIASNSANTIFVQFTYFGSVFVLFLDALGLNKSQVGFLLSLLPFLGIISLFVAPAVARSGYKRTYVSFFGLRTFVTAFLLFTPWFFSNFGVQITLVYVAIIVGLFAICRSVGMTAWFPWVQEYVPNAVRGKYSATNNRFALSVGFVAVTAAGFVLDRAAGLSGYMVLIAVGVVAGLVSTWAAAKIPGGAPVHEKQSDETAVDELREAVRDKDFMYYLFGAGLMTLTITPLTSFVPLFMQEQVGISSGNVVLLQNGTLLGSLLSTFLWGWAADRYGSRPVMLSGACFKMLLPVMWMLMPRNSESSLYIALVIAFLQGISNMGWLIGAQRLLYVSVVPPEKKQQYMALYNAWVGVAGGVSQLLGGQIVQYSAGLSGQFLIFSLDPYTGLFVSGILLPLLSVLLLRGVRADTQVTVEQFAGLFLRGNPFTAITSLVGYHLAKNERDVITMTERLGGTKSPLTVEELLELLEDPRFNVRFEAIISIARMRSDPRLTEAIIQTLNGTELALSTLAAWALGRIGDEQAAQALHAGLDSPYHSIQAHSARALGALGDKKVIPMLLQRLEQETDKGLQMAYASALGKLKARQADKALLNLLRTFENPRARMELALSLARLVGEEGHFIQLFRQTRQETGTATAQALSVIRHKFEKDQENSQKIIQLMDSCTNALAKNELERGTTLLGQMIQLLPPEKFEPCALTILKDCAGGWDETEPPQLEYVLLALHALDIGWQS